MEVHTEGSLLLPETITTIGAFDGVHRGHQTVIKETVRQSKLGNIPSVVYTFDPPPRAYFQDAYILSSIKEKVNKLQKLGIDYVVIAQFDESYINRTPESFIKELEYINPRNIRVGEDFRFGKNRKGDVTLLKRYFSVELVKSVCCAKGRRISSTRIRELILDGDVQQTKSLLGWTLDSAN